MTTNAFARLRRLLPRPPLLVGEITSIDNNIATILLPGGATIQARGTGTVGNQAFVRDGVIESDAPSLPVVEIEI